jgi:dihydroorotate dehydrogenase (NAD+) catalytic subunit
MSSREKRPKLAVKLAGVELKNPVMPASGTFGSGKEYEEYLDLEKLGMIVTKGVADRPWKGNPTPRVAETHGGMLNSVGLQNPGIEHFLREDLPFLQSRNTKTMVNIAGRSIEEYVRVVTALQRQPVDFLELNISCPNIKEGGVAFGTEADMAYQVTKKVKAAATQPLIVKLSPNVTDIGAVARACEAAGADGISLINTLLGMKIDIKTRRPLLANTFGGLSGPAIKPVALRMVYQAAKEVKIPIIGIGGISTWEDALEFILAGAAAVQVGTANFRNPRAMLQIIEGLENYLRTENIDGIEELIGAGHELQEGIQC